MIEYNEGQLNRDSILNLMTPFATEIKYSMGKNYYGSIVMQNYDWSRCRKDVNVRVIHKHQNTCLIF